MQVKMLSTKLSRRLVRDAGDRGAPLPAYRDRASPGEEDRSPPRVPTSAAKMERVIIPFAISQRNGAGLAAVYFEFAALIVDHAQCLLIVETARGEFVLIIPSLIAMPLASHLRRF